MGPLVYTIWFLYYINSQTPVSESAMLRETGACSNNQCGLRKPWLFLNQRLPFEHTSLSILLPTLN